jgi:hypothetical protein
MKSRNKKIRSFRFEWAFSIILACITAPLILNKTNPWLPLGVLAIGVIVIVAYEIILSFREDPEDFRCSVDSNTELVLKSRWKSTKKGFMRKIISAAGAVGVAAVVEPAGEGVAVAQTAGMMPPVSRQQLTQSSSPQNSVTLIAELPSPSAQSQKSR